MEDKPSSIFDKIYDVLLSGNPIIVVLVLLVLAVLGSWWVFQTVQNPVVDFPTPKIRHINVKTMAVPNGLNTMPPPQTTPTPLSAVVATPKAAFLHNSPKMLKAVEPNRKTFSLSFLADTPARTRSFSR